MNTTRNVRISGCRGRLIGFKRNGEPSSKSKTIPWTSGFTLIELLAVITIMLLVIGMAVPSLDSIMSGGGRKGATVMSMNLFEQARATAIQTGVNTYVGIPLAEFPSEDHRFRSMILFRDYDAELDAAPTSGSPPSHVPLSSWYTLPKGISFKQMASSVITPGGAAAFQVTVNKADGFPLYSENVTSTPLAAIQWTPTGMIQQPTSRSVFLYEGQYLNSQETPLRQVNRFSGANAANSNFYDQLVLSQFTGRPQLKVASFTN